MVKRESHRGGSGGGGRGVFWDSGNDIERRQKEIELINFLNIF